jgi:hypothetical protein
LMTPAQPIHRTSDGKMNRTCATMFITHHYDANGRCRHIPSCHAINFAKASNSDRLDISRLAQPPRRVPLLCEQCLQR